MPEVIGAIVTLFFVGIVVRGLFPTTYRKLCDKIDAWGEKGTQPKTEKPKVEHPVGIKHQ